MQTEAIKNIILDYCEGYEQLWFCKSDMPMMIYEIKQAILNEIDDAENLLEASNYVKDYL